MKKKHKPTRVNLTTPHKGKRKKSQRSGVNNLMANDKN
jgi:hypothetical protein